MANLQRLIRQAGSVLGDRRRSTGRSTSAGRGPATGGGRRRPAGGRGVVANGIANAVQGFVRGSGRR